MQFNIADLGHTLMTDFLVAGGKFVRAEFHEPAELGRLKEKVCDRLPRLWRAGALEGRQRHARPRPDRLA